MVGPFMQARQSQSSAVQSVANRTGRYWLCARSVLHEVLLAMEQSPCALLQQSRCAARPVTALELSEV